MNTLKTSLYAGLMLCLSLLTACGGGSDPVPSNVINSSTGLRLDLEWTTGGTSSDAISDSDLDLYLMKGTNEAAKSISGYSFETVRIQDIYSDGEYVVDILAYRTAKRTNYTLYVKGDDEGEIKSFNSYFLATDGDQDLKISFLKIKKAGSTYTISTY